jgi:Na+-transporting NADH:ubiquinone oxidoreductase subunit C
MAVTAILVGGLLALAATGLKEKQTEAIELDTKKQILSAVMTLEKGADAKSLYGNHIEGIVVDINGNKIEKDEEGNALAADKINIAKEFKKEASKRKYPVFIFKKDGKNGKADAYILPTFGNGLWNTISGYVAVSGDLNSIFGATFAHVGETPGLGARISEPEVQARFKGKKIFKENGEIASVTMMKGEGNNYDSQPHQVDGMSGATITARGLNDMLKKYFEHYSAYFNQLKSAESKPAEINMNAEVDSLQNDKPDTTKVEGEATPATK